uniref:Uncharacterized protein n=1 Tax=Rhizophora mucronata TaxID=61149 RepID=A0A2P2P628_RHIMU
MSSTVLIIPINHGKLKSYIGNKIVDITW